LSELKLEDLIDIEAVLIDIPFTKTIDIKLKDLETLDSSHLEGKAVLFNTGWDKHWGTEKYFDGNPFLTKEVAEFLRESKGKFSQ
jgi:arylformamidase